MISSRYAPGVALLLALALVPTVIHSYLGLTIDDGMSAENISQHLDGFMSGPAKRNSSWGEDVFDSPNWIERIYKKSGYPPVRLFVARSYHHKKLYHHPELALSYGGNLADKGEVSLSGLTEIPVRLFRSQTNPGVVAYALLYGDQFVGNPISHQIRDSFHMLTSAKAPMTLFYVSSQEALSKENFKQSAVARILKAAIESFLAQNSAAKGP